MTVVWIFTGTETTNKLRWAYGVASHEYHRFIIETSRVVALSEAHRFWFVDETKWTAIECYLEHAP